MVSVSTHLPQSVYLFLLIELSFLLMIPMRMLVVSVNNPRDLENSDVVDTLR